MERIIMGIPERVDTICGHKAKDIILSIAWRREAWKEEPLDDLP